MGVGVVHLVAQDQNLALMVEEGIADRIPVFRVDGVDVFLPLHEMGADPNKKDIFVQYLCQR